MDRGRVPCPGLAAVPVRLGGAAVIAGLQIVALFCGVGVFAALAVLELVLT